MNLDIEAKILTAKALRKSFIKTQSELLTDIYSDDVEVLFSVVNMQKEYGVFNQLVEEIKVESRSLYESEILGIK